MKINEIRGKDTRELLLDRNDLRKEQFKLRFKATAEEVSNTARFKQIRRTIAKINTVLGERERAERAAAAARKE
jgi:large subunit ribosomal protein L29